MLQILCSFINIMRVNLLVELCKEMSARLIKHTICENGTAVRDMVENSCQNK